MEEEHLYNTKECKCIKRSMKTLSRLAIILDGRRLQMFTGDALGSLHKRLLWCLGPPAKLSLFCLPSFWRRCLKESQNHHPKDSQAPLQRNRVADQKAKRKAPFKTLALGFYSQRLGGHTAYWHRCGSPCVLFCRCYNTMLQYFAIVL